MLSNKSSLARLGQANPSKFKRPRQVGALEKMDSLDAALAERHTDLLTMRHKVRSLHQQPEVNYLPRFGLH